MFFVTEYYWVLPVIVTCAFEAYDWPTSLLVSYYINPEVTDYYVCGFVPLWLCGFVALWLFGFLALWFSNVAYPVRTYGTVY